MVFVVEKIWVAQTSNSRTQLGFKSSKPFLPVTTPPDVTFITHVGTAVQSVTQGSKKDRYPAMPFKMEQKWGPCPWQQRYRELTLPSLHQPTPHSASHCGQLLSRRSLILIIYLIIPHEIRLRHLQRPHPIKCTGSLWSFLWVMGLWEISSMSLFGPCLQAQALKALYLLQYVGTHVKNVLTILVLTQLWSLLKPLLDPL